MPEPTKPRFDGRRYDALRPVEITVGFQRNAEGSVLYRAGGTVVLCTASIDAKVPPFLEGKGKGWLTAEYQMHPRASPARRESRDGRGKAPSGRTLEIQRLVGRALRAAVELDRVGERTLTIDCDVLEADGGTRTASVTGGFIALALALAKLHKDGILRERVLREPIAATSVGCLAGGALALDLAYVEDSKAEFDLNVVATASGAIVEVQGTAETVPMARKDVDRMVDLALGGVRDLIALQRETLAKAGVDLSALLRAETR
jgi:ribonuclease PH